jgi:hypothetical protein
MSWPSDAVRRLGRRPSHPYRRDDGDQHGRRPDLQEVLVAEPIVAAVSD